MKMTIFLVGKLSPDILPSLLEKNYKVGIFLDNDLPSKEIPSEVQIIPVDFTNKNTVLNSIKKIKIKIDCLITRYENYIVAKTWIAEALKLKAPSEDSAYFSSDKLLMREQFQNYDKSITPEFKFVSSENDLLDFSNSHSFPLIIKPTNLVKSLLVFKSNNMKELISNYKKMKKSIKKTYRKYNVKAQKPKILIEEYVNGSKHSVAAFADSNGRIVVADEIADLEMGEDIKFKDNFVYSRIIPSQLPKSKQQELKEAAIKGMKALNLTNSPGHVEVFLTKSGPKIIEIGARVGGYRARMYKLASGIDLDKAEVDIALGKTPNLSSKKNNHCCVIELFPEKKGKFLSIKNSELLKKLKTFNYFSIKAKKARITGLSSDGYKASGLIVLSSSSRNILLKDIEWIKRNIKVIVK